MSDEARAESPEALPIFDESGLVPVEQARKLTPEQAALLREFKHVPPGQVEGEDYSDPTDPNIGH